jgi:hypothetical protein
MTNPKKHNSPEMVNYAFLICYAKKLTIYV